MSVSSRTPVLVGCAGWAIPSSYRGSFSGDGSHLERYAAIFRGVEINSSFYRPHQPQTYRRWGTAVPDGFQFSVKIPKVLTHERRLRDVTPSDLESFLEPVLELGKHLGPLLVQLPPSLKFDRDVAAEFFTMFRERFTGGIALEPRHPSWWSVDAEGLVSELRISIVAADPALHGSLASGTIPKPAGWSGLAYFRLHGSPTMYYSDYPDELLHQIAKPLLHAAKRDTAVWCIFDNTAAGAAQRNALRLLENLEQAALQSRSGRPAKNGRLANRP